MDYHFVSDVKSLAILLSYCIMLGICEVRQFYRLTCNVSNDVIRWAVLLDLSILLVMQKN